MEHEDLLRDALPQLDGIVRVSGLDDRVVVLRDRLGIPHVRARSVHDAFYAQGFVHAQDRLWQMEYDRHRADGRLAELLGPHVLKLDAFVRRVGITESARADYAAFDTETRAMLDAYAEGVNAFLETTNALPVELSLLGVTPARWEPWHAGAIFKVRHVLMGTYDAKLWRAHVLRTLGADALVRLASPGGRDDTLIVPVAARETWSADRDDLEPGALAVAAMPDGSNSWALRGARTASGLPLLAGDPHRMLEVPNVYYQNRIACPDLDAIGLSMPGVPGIFHFGHNGAVAWCITHAMADTQDLFVERFAADGTYEHHGEALVPERRTETLHARGGEVRRIDVVRTVNGPIVFGDPAAGSAIAMRWTATDGFNSTLTAVLPMLRARSVDELEDAMRPWVDPCNSLLIADVHGTVAYLHRGRIPIRPRANGWVPVPGWTGAHTWQGSVPFEELPRARDPEIGFIVTANNRVRGSDYPHYLSLDYSPPNRARRIIGRLEELGSATVEDMEAIHRDRVSLASRALVALAGDLRPRTELGARARALLQTWDGSMDPDGAAPAVYAALRDRLAALLLERDPLARLGFAPFPDEPYPTPLHTRIRSAVPRLVGSDDRTLVGDGGWADIASEALEAAAALLAERLGPDPSAWRWDALHVTQARHPLSRAFPDLAGALDPPRVGMGGDGDTVLAGSAEKGLGVLHTSVARYVFDVSDWDRSRWVVPFGSSGHPASAHYSDQASAWARGELHAMTYTWELVEAEAESRQVLESR